jgi:hypothetical protein
MANIYYSIKDRQKEPSAEIQAMRFLADTLNVQNHSRFRSLVITWLKTLLCIFFSAVCVTLCSADAIDPNIKGILVITKAATVDKYLREYAANGDYPFTSISWYSSSGGNVTDINGKSVRFSCDSVSKIIYFNSEYYSNVSLENEIFRTDIISREVVVEPTYKEILTSTELSTVEDNKQKLEKLNIASLSPYIDLLNGYISRFKIGQRYINGKWVSLAKDELNHVYGPLSLTADNTSYDGVYIALDGPDSPILFILTSTGGASIDIRTVSLPEHASGFPLELVERIADYHLGALLSSADGGVNAAFMNQAEAVGQQSQGFVSLQNQLSDVVMTALIKGVADPDKRALILNEWPKLKKAILFTPQQQIAFYKALIEGCSLSINECKTVLALANSADSPPELKSIIASWSDQISAAGKLNAQMEQVLLVVFANPTNGLLLQTTETKDELSKPVNLSSDGDAIFNGIAVQLQQTTLSCVKTTLQAYENSWSQLISILQIRASLAGGKLGDVAMEIPKLNNDPKIANSLTSGQKAVAAACDATLMLYENQKDAAQKLLDEAERLKALGGQNSKALQAYKDAYKLNDDPSILQKINDLNNESLGL